MNRRTIATILVTTIALVGLVIAWPAIAGTSRRPRIGDWVPETDPGTHLALIHRDRQELFGFGENFHCVDMQSQGPQGYLQLETLVYAERDGKLGHEGEGSTNSLVGKYQGILTDQTSLSGGYRDNHFLHAELQHQDGVTSTVIVGPPIDIQERATTAWRPLVAIPHGFAVEWRQTASALELRRVTLPGATEPQWNGGQLQIQNGTARANYDWVANSISVPRTNLPFPSLGPAHVLVFVEATPTGVNVGITLK